jgi:glycosyltransferase involved in cell wall biosynthesis
LERPVSQIGETNATRHGNGNLVSPKARVSDTGLPLVSVAVVTYNQKDFLRECLESILAQDYPAVQIVVADDASTDGTAEMLAQYGARHPGIFKILVAEKNKGVTANQSLALSGCEGKYIAWIAGDDLMLPGKLAAQVTHLEANPRCNICYHDLEMFDSRTGQVKCLRSDVDRPRNGEMGTLVRYGAFNGAVSNMVRRSASPMGFDENIQTASDWLYYVECLAGGGTIEYIDAVLGRYRRHDNNITGDGGREPQVHLWLDHLKSCAVILAKWPEVAADVRKRQSSLLTQLRWRENGKYYDTYLRAALSYQFSVKVLAGWLAAALLGIRR